MKLLVPRFGPMTMTPEETIAHAMLHGSLEMKQVAAIADLLLEQLEALSQTQVQCELAGDPLPEITTPELEWV